VVDEDKQHQQTEEIHVGDYVAHVLYELLQLETF